MTPSSVISYFLPVWYEAILSPICRLDNSVVLDKRSAIPFRRIPSWILISEITPRYLSYLIFIKIVRCGLSFLVNIHSQ